ncbi:MAG: FecR domain-containing protein [Saprospiraceae bacterium]
MMEETNEVRIGRFLSGAAGSDERLAFENELESNPGLKNDFLAYKQVWENSHCDSPSEWDTNKAWQRFSETTLSEQNEIRTTRRINLKWAIAAVVVISLASFLISWSNNKAVSYAYNEKDTKPLVLSDGSKIYLNKGSSVDVFPFKHNKRRVALNGEAFFEVAPDTQRPFTVESGGTITEVVGTAFNISQTKENTRIFVERGKVIFKSAEKIKEALALAAGEAAQFDENRMQLIPNPSPNINAWHTQHLSFTKNMSLNEIIRDASTYFNRPISLENVALRDCRISNTLIYNNPEINAVLKPLASFVNGTIKIDGEKYIIVGGNCP